MQHVLMELLTWYNNPFFLMVGISFFFLFLMLVGGGDHDTDTDVDVDLDLDVDVDVDLDIDADFEIGKEIPISGKDYAIDTELKDYSLENSTGKELPFLIKMLTFINAGNVPLSIILMLSFFGWGSSGFLLNQVVKVVFGTYISIFFAINLGLSFMASMFATRQFSKLFALFFKEHTAAESAGSLMGCIATVISNQLPESGSSTFGQAYAYTENGVLRKISCVIPSGAQMVGKEDEVFITGYDREKDIYTVILYDSPDFHQYLSGNQSTFASVQEKTKKSLKYQQQREKEL